MALNIERFAMDVRQEGELSLTPAQVDRLVALVIGKLEERAREAQRSRAATKPTRQASRSLEVGD